MAAIDLMPLSDRLDDDEIEDLTEKLKKAGAKKLPAASEDESATIADEIDDDAMQELLDLLDAHDIACEVYLPVEFDGHVEVADLRVGSAQQLVEVLDEIRDDIFQGEAEEAEAEEDEDVDEDEEDEPEEEEDEDDEEEEAEEHLRAAWKALHAGARAAVDKRMPLHVQI